MAFRKLSADELAAIRDRHTAATPGPYRWAGNSSGFRPTVWLQCIHGLRNTVLTFRRWGMQGAEPMFQTDGLLVDPDYVRPESHNPWRITGIDHPDAEALAHSWGDVDALLAHLEALEFEVGTLRGLLQCERGETVSIEELRAKYGTRRKGEG